MGKYLLVIVLVFMGFELLLGLLRGISSTILRLCIGVLGTLAAWLAAVKITPPVLTAFLEAQGYYGESLGEMFADIASSEMSYELAEAIGTPLAGLCVSLVIPFIFGIFFLTAKLVTWIVFLIVRAVLKHKGVLSYPASLPAWSRAAGAAMGAVIGVYVCAMVLLCPLGLIDTVERADSKDILLDMVAEEYSEEYVSAYNSIVDSAGMKLCRYTGALTSVRAVSRACSTVKPEVVTSILDEDGSTNDTADGRNAALTDEGAGDAAGTYDEEFAGYNFSKAFAGCMSAAGEVTELMAAIEDGQLLNSTTIDQIDGLLDSVAATDIIAYTDKLNIINASVWMLQDMFTESTGLGSLPVEAEYTDLETFENDMDAVLGMLRALAGLKSRQAGGDTDTGSSTAAGEGTGSNTTGAGSTGGILDGIDMGALIEDTEAREELVHSALMLSNGGETLAEYVNEAIVSGTDGEVGAILDTEAFLQADETQINELMDIISDVTDYADKEELDSADKAALESAIDKAIATGLTDEDMLEELRSRLIGEED